MSMRRHSMSCVALSLIGVLAAGCEESTSPEIAAVPAASASFSLAHLGVSKSLDDVFLTISRTIPEFGGAFQTADTLFIALTNLSAVSRASGHVGPYLAAVRAHGFQKPENARLRFIVGEYSFSQLRAWFEGINSKGWPSGMSTLDIDERSNKIRATTESSTNLGPIRATLIALGIPSPALTVVAEPSAVPLQSLWGKLLPRVAGSMIRVRDNTADFFDDCTLGLNVYERFGSAVDSSHRYFLTASHCGSDFAMLSDTAAQPAFHATLTVTAHATEVADPGLFEGDPCPNGKLCRWSDAALFEYADSVPFYHGGVV